MVACLLQRMRTHDAGMNARRTALREHHLVVDRGHALADDGHVGAVGRGVAVAEVVPIDLR